MTMRSVQDRFWSDGWVRKLNPLDRYLFLYLLTNEHTTWCGIYELDLGMMAFESGLDERDLERAFLPKLAPKVVYVEGWVYIPNWVKHHLSESGSMSPSQEKGFKEAFEKVPEKIRAKINEIASGEYTLPIPYTYPMGGVSPSASASASITAAKPAEFSYSVEEETDRPKKGARKDKEYDEMISWLEGVTGVRIINRAKQYAHLAKARAADISKTRLKNRANELLGESWYQQNGLDWGGVVSSFDRKA